MAINKRVPIGGKKPNASGMKAPKVKMAMRKTMKMRTPGAKGY